MNDVGYKEANDWANEVAEGLTAYDFDFTDWVALNHSDGSKFVFRYAFRREFHDFVGVFTEHHGHYVFHKEDLEDIRDNKSTGDCCENEDRDMNGGCKNCGDPCL